MNISIQAAIVAVVILLCLGYVGNRIFHYFNGIKKGENPCANCSSGCDLRRMMDEKKNDCKSKSVNAPKNCCK